MSDISKKAVFIITMGILLSCFAQHASGQSLRTVTLLPQWSPQAQFAGYYVAEAKGFYKQNGLEVKILKGGPESPAGPGLASGQADFATMFLTEAMALKDQGVPIVNVAQIVRRSALMLVAKKQSNIKSPADFDKKRVSIWDDFMLQPLSFFRRNQVDVEVVSQGHTVNLFLMGGVDAASAMWYNEYYTIINSGIDPEQLTTFMLADHGLNFPEDGIYCLEKTLRQDPEAVSAFVKASIRGWQHAFQHPDQALDIVMRHVRDANLPTNRVHQKWMLKRMKDIIMPEDDPGSPGFLDISDFLFVAQQLKQYKIIQSIPDYTEFYEPINQKR
jgi:NitT/TauT family transport system substrate-binding protein